ncbi:hypothetical protein HRbin23_00543 [bacterium HR23]|nr:hypothetical protein HRbin23_00543 [bacterium HR23]
MRRFVALCIALAGVVHLALTPQHYAHAPAHGILFAVAGLAQIAWAVAFWRRPTLLLWNLGILGAMALIVLWLLTRFLPAPFGHGPEAVTALGIAVKICEATAVATLVGMLLGKGVVSVPRPGRHALLWVASGVVGGLLFFGVASAVDGYLPALGAREHTHQEEGNHIHQEGDHSAAPSSAPHQHQ